MATLRIRALSLSRLEFPKQCSCCLTALDHDGMVQSLTARRELTLDAKKEGAPAKKIEFKKTIHIPTCPECQQHWKLAEEHATRGVEREMKVAGPILGVIAVFAIWSQSGEIDSAWWIRGLLWALALIVVAAFTIWLPQLLRRPRSKKGHVPFHKVPVWIDPNPLAPANGLLLHVANKEFARQIAAQNGSLVIRPSWKMILIGVGATCGFLALTIYLLTDGFSWWSVATGLGVLIGLVVWWSAFDGPPKEALETPQ
jgi:hypothetical protein